MVKARIVKAYHDAKYKLFPMRPDAFDVFAAARAARAEDLEAVEALDADQQRYLDRSDLLADALGAAIEVVPAEAKAAGA